MVRPEFFASMYARFFKIQTFCQKWDQLCFYSPLYLNLLEVDTIKLRDLLCKLKEELFYFCWLEKFFAHLKSIVIRKTLKVFAMLKNFV